MTRNYLDILAETIRNNWDQPALTDFYLTEDGTAQDTSRGNHYTYGEMYAEIVRVADLLTRLGLQKGDHIAICGANSAHWVIAYLAIAKMQGVSVTIMHSLQPDQIALMVGFSDAKALFVDKELWRELKEQSLPQVKSVISLEAWQILRGEKDKIPNRKSLIENRECGFDFVEPDSLAMICFTSGSTGNPKGVMIPYRSINANVDYQFKEYSKVLINRSIIVSLPMAHTYSSMNECIKPLCFGMNVNIVTIPIFIQQFLSYSHLINPAYIDLVPQMLQKIITSTQAKSILQKKDLISVFVGGAKIPNDIEKILPQLGVPVTTGYGISECGPIISATLPDKYRIGSAGLVLPTLEVTISSKGEILVKGENVMLGYYKDPGATARKIDKDGWLHTGDKGHLDEDGYLYVEGRLEQDIIVLPNGENIRPDNIESLINALPEVKESIVLARDGKLVARVVVPSSLPFREESEVGSLRRMILRQINPKLPLFSQLYDAEITDVPLQRTEKQTIKRYLYS